jgi:hypothetical protein
VYGLVFVKYVDGPVSFCTVIQKHNSSLNDAMGTSKNNSSFSVLDCNQLDQSKLVVVDKKDLSLP